MNGSSGIKTAGNIKYRLYNLGQNVVYQAMIDGSYLVDPLFENQFIKQMESIKALEDYLLSNE